MSNKENAGLLPITLESTFQAMRHWRHNKKEYGEPGIPDTLWGMFFQLEDAGYTGAEIRSLFTLNTHQYSVKKKQLYKRSSSKQSSTASTQEQVMAAKPPKEAVSFSEFCVASTKASSAADVPSLTQVASETKKAIATLKSTKTRPEDYLDMSTSIVECIRPDGHRLKIHITNQSLDIVMQTFFKAGVALS